MHDSLVALPFLVSEGSSDMLLVFYLLYAFADIFIKFPDAYSVGGTDM